MMKRSPGSSSNGSSSFSSRESGLAGLELLGAQQVDLGDGLGGEGVKMHARAVAQRLG